MWTTIISNQTNEAKCVQVNQQYCKTTHKVSSLSFSSLCYMLLEKEDFY